MNHAGKVLVVYYSLTGHTSRVGVDLATRLNADVESIVDHKRRTGAFGVLTAAVDGWRKAPTSIGSLRRDPSDYAVTVIGSPVWAGQMAPAVRSYLRAMRGNIRALALFTTSNSTGVARIQPSVELEAGRPLIGATGFHMRELDDPAQYDDKIARLADAVRKAAATTSPLRLVS